MENEVKSAGPGVVKEVLVQPGQAVEAGEVLARLE
jgi:biotin carboxyl carrier protein